MRCSVCGRIIAVLIFSGEKWCCDMCRKIAQKELTPQEAVEFLLTVSDIVTPHEKEHLDTLVRGARNAKGE